MKKKKLKKLIVALSSKLSYAFEVQTRMQHRISKLETALFEIDNPFLNIGPDGKLLPADKITTPEAVYDQGSMPVYVASEETPLQTRRRMALQKQKEAADLARAGDFLKTAAEKGPIDDVAASKITPETLEAIEQEPVQIAQRRRSIDLGASSEKPDLPQFPVVTSPLRIGQN